LVRKEETQGQLVARKTLLETQIKALKQQLGKPALMQIEPIVANLTG
jgi:hypothetical protein